MYIASLSMGSWLCTLGMTWPDYMPDRGSLPANQYALGRLREDLPERGGPGNHVMRVVGHCDITLGSWSLCLDMMSVGTRYCTKMVSPVDSLSMKTSQLGFMRVEDLKHSSAQQ